MEQKALVRYQKTAQQRAEMVAAFKQSGMSVNQFADEHHLTRSTLMRWVADVDRGSECHAPELIEVSNPLAGSEATPSGGTVYISPEDWFWRSSPGLRSASCAASSN